MFAIGSVVAALSHSIDGIILGRLLQGAGAVGSATLALAADLTREHNRTKAMAIIGMTIGMSFQPGTGGWAGSESLDRCVRDLLADCGAGLAGYRCVVWLVPQPAVSRYMQTQNRVSALCQTGADKIRNYSPGFRHPCPARDPHGQFPEGAVRAQASGITQHGEWQIYLPALIISVMVMAPMIIQAERHGRMRPIMLGAVTAIGLAQVLFLLDRGGWWLPAVALAVFFTAFNFLEAVLPSLISRLAPGQARGTAMGVYSSAQFLGIFLGGVLGGLCQGRFGLAGSFGFSLVMALLWLAVSWSVRPPVREKPGRQVK